MNQFIVPGEPIVFCNGFQRFAVILLFFVFGTSCIYVGINLSVNVFFVIFGCFIVFFGFMLLLRTFPGILKPACCLDKGGFCTPIHGRIAWSEVDGICLKQIRNRWGTTSSSLLFLVRNYNFVVSDVHWTERVLAWFGLGALRSNIVGLLLLQRREEVKNFYASARSFWKEATGRTHEWDPAKSDAYNEAAKCFALASSQISDSLDSADPRCVRPEMLRAKMQQMDRDIELMRSDDEREMKKGMFFIYALLGAGVVCAVLAILSRFG